MTRIFISFICMAAGAWGGTEHWAFQPLTSPAVPEGEAETPVDAFVTDHLADQGLELSPPADPARWLRRVYLDLTGLPPSREEIEIFRADPSDEAYVRVVDDLLASPRYGERWGRHWLDLARYADSNGLHEDTDRPHAWRYRDYVIESFNEDKPYGQFIREQIAGDLIDPDNPEAWIATGFCRNGPSNEENVAKNEVEIYRLDQLDDIIATTTQVFLGQTIACARCHDHKTEPFTQTDYYRLLAVFDDSVAAYVPFSENGLGKPELRPVRARSKRKPPEEPQIRALAQGDSRVTRVLLRGNPETAGEEVEPGIPVVFRHFRAAFEESEDQRAALADWIASPENPLTWRVMANRLWQHHFGRGLVETPSNFGESGAPPSHPELLDWLACQLRDNGGRLKPLHRQIVLSRTYRQNSAWRSEAGQIDPDNRQLWRYPPHRLEAEVIRDRILAASGNLNLEPGGPGIKPRVPPAILEQSKRNSWPKVGREGPEHWRRSVYIYLKRQLPMPMLTLFDAPDAAQTCAERFTSTTPTQALTLLNDAFVNEQAKYLAERVLATNPENAAREAIERVLAFPAAEDRVTEAEAFVKERLAVREDEVLALADLCVVLYNSSEFVYVD